MHPILFTIPLPKTQVPALYFYLAAIALGLIYAAVSWFVQKDKANALGGVAVAAVALGLKFAGVLENIANDPSKPAEAGKIWIGPLPIYSYGVMLGLSLVVGWYLTLGLAKRDGLPQETMANNYVITAVAAIAGSRILYVLTNLNEFNSPVDIFALRRGGLVAYGGFLGGFLGSLFYLRKQQIPLLPWADVAVPSLASGLMITRVGCYLFGCDFGRPLCRVAEEAGNLTDYPLCASAEAAPGWLQKIGTFPRWAAGLLHDGQGFEGSPAWRQHVDAKYIDDGQLASLPVHPTQLYESLVGAGLLALLLYARTKQKFRGQIFLLFTFAYGVARYLIEILRDDKERGSLPFSFGKHTMIALGLVIFAVGFSIGFSKLIHDPMRRRVAQALAFVPAVVFYFVLAPASWGDSVQYQWSTSQFVGLTTGFAACIAFSVFYKAALAHPEAAMRIHLPPGEGEEAPVDEKNVADADDEDDEDEEDAKPATKKPAAKKPAAKDAAKKPAAKDADADADDDDDNDDEAAKPKPKTAAKPAAKKPAAKKPAPKPKAQDDDADEGADEDAEAPAKPSAKKSADDDEDADKPDDEKAG